MEIQKYVDSKREIQRTLLDFFQNLSSDENYFHSLTDILYSKEIFRSADDLKEFLHLLSKISNNSHRLQHFSEKIEQILLY